MATAALGLDKVHSFLRGRECACAGSPVFSNDNPGIIPKRHVPFIMRPQALAALFPRHARISLRKTTSGVVSCDPAGARDRTEFGEGPSGKRGGKSSLLPRAIVYRWRTVANCGICLLWKTSWPRS
jgi:hypothetical protein